jgi:hypothetical protein
MRRFAQEVLMSAQPRTTRRSPARMSPIATLVATVVGAAAVLSACSSSGSRPASQDNPEQPAAAAAPAAAPAPDPTAAPAASGDSYSLDRDGTQVTLAVTGDQGAIAFELVAQSADEACRLRLSGTAKGKDGDSETREDENGEMFEVAEYLYESTDCWVSISLDSAQRSMAWVSTADCTSVPASCWLNMFGPLRKQ